MGEDWCRQTRKHQGINGPARTHLLYMRYRYGPYSRTKTMHIGYLLKKTLVSGQIALEVPYFADLNEESIFLSPHIIISNLKIEKV